MKKERFSFEAVYLKGHVYVFRSVGNSKNLVKTVEKYSPLTDKWNVATEMFDDRLNFRACSFINKVFILGSHFYDSYDDDDPLATSSSLD